VHMQAVSKALACQLHMTRGSELDLIQLLRPALSPVTLPWWLVHVQNVTKAYFYAVVPN
jgi:hypothetical protein